MDEIERVRFGIIMFSSRMASDPVFMDLYERLADNNPRDWRGYTADLYIHDEAFDYRGDED